MTVPAVVALVALPAVAAFRLATCVVLITLRGAVPVAILLLNTVALTCALTSNAVNVPWLVIFGCAAVVTVPAVVALVALPAVAAFRFAT